jgi:hypothetical protein
VTCYYFVAQRDLAFGRCANCIGAPSAQIIQRRAASVFSEIGFRRVNENSLTPKGTSTLSGAIQEGKYRVHTGTRMNVHELDEAGRPKMGWCFVPSGSLVAGDIMLAQKVALEAFEYSALAAAKRFMPNSNAGPAW